MTNLTKTQLVKILKHNVEFEIAGWTNKLDNDGFDEEYGKKEFEEILSAKNLINYLQGGLNDSYKKGYYEDEQTGIMIESKHIKFLGKETISESIASAVFIALVPVANEYPELNINMDFE